ncbi:hypothetical protein KUTeg_004969 [Tegillarca granosa]|uniref:DAGKc domain-containing protein n=1 Tax=Tegillarca granosa TaxID=220873 RepID=A0ABQ9FLB2_TEGGR|nr:hypothetical protein KUTeg_004969 [Tegillarca granosa]
MLKIQTDLDNLAAKWDTHTSFQARRRFADNILLNGIESKLLIENNQLIFQDVEKTVKETWKISDVIGIEHQSVDAGKQKEIKIHVIEDTDQNNLIDKTATLEAEEHVLREIVRRIKEQISKVSCRPRSLLVLINPVGGSKAGEQIYSEVVAPIFRLAEIETEILVSKQSKYFLNVLKTYDISKFDGIVICGGDGTVNECLASIYRRAQEDAGIDCNDPNAKVVPFPLPICQIPTVLPFVHFLLKRQPCYDVEIQLYRKHGSTKTVKDTIVNLVTMNFDGYTENFHYSPERRFDQTVVFTYKPSWGTQLLSQLLTFLLTRTKNVVMITNFITYQIYVLRFITLLHLFQLAFKRLII